MNDPPWRLLRNKQRVYRRVGKKTRGIDEFMLGACPPVLGQQAGARRRAHRLAARARLGPRPAPQRGAGPPTSGAARTSARVRGAGAAVIYVLFILAGFYAGTILAVRTR